MHPTNTRTAKISTAIIIGLLTFIALSLATRTGTAVEYLARIFSPESASAATQSERFAATTCGIQDYTKLNSSKTIRTDKPWSLLNINVSTGSGLNNTINSFFDVNGDSLLDFVYVKDAGSVRYECLLMNNGAGWNVAYRCVLDTTTTIGEVTAYGDCAG